MIAPDFCSPGCVDSAMHTVTNHGWGLDPAGAVPCRRHACNHLVASRHLNETSRARDGEWNAA